MAATCGTDAPYTMTYATNLFPLKSASVGETKSTVEGGDIITNVNGCGVKPNGGSATVRFLTQDMRPVSRLNPNYSRGGESCICRVPGDTAGGGNNDPDYSDFTWGKDGDKGCFNNQLWGYNQQGYEDFNFIMEYWEDGQTQLVWYMPFSLRIYN